VLLAMCLQGLHSSYSLLCCRLLLSDRHIKILAQLFHVMFAAGLCMPCLLRAVLARCKFPKGATQSSVEAGEAGEG
jgi:hypothetical protein